jgi:hypothetical protein
MLEDMEDASVGGDEPRIGFHAPSVTVALLQQAASVVEIAAEQLPGEAIFFPKREEGESQPIELEGHVDLGDIAGLLRYLADMLDV